jgi:hypothetical protein
MIRIRALHRPGSTLSEPEKIRLREEVLELNLRLSDSPAFVRNWRVRVGTFLEDMERLWLLRDESGALVGHGGYRLLEDNPDGVMVYWDNYTIAPELQGQGLAVRLSAYGVGRLFLQGRGRRVYLVSRTCNPLIVGITWKMMPVPHLYYPSMDPKRHNDPELRRIAACAAATLWPDKQFLPESGVLVGAYGGKFLPSVPSPHGPTHEHFARHVDEERGDAIVQVMSYRLSALPHLLRIFVKRARRTWASRTKRGASGAQGTQNSRG